MELGLEGRVALVMGASKGIGRGIAGALAREGARVALASRSRARLEEAAAEIGGETAVFEYDTAELARLPRLPEDVRGKFGPIEILVTNTGGPPVGGALDADLDEWRKAYDNLVLAPRVLIETVLPTMRERGWGRIVNVGSSATREPIPGLALSNSHRPGQVGFFKTLSREVAAEGITVNDIVTGRFATDRLAANWGGWEQMKAEAAKDVPAGRLGKPEEYGDLVAFLCSERAAYITGASIPIDGGLLRSI
ncbi:MAG: 3-oxoacyl-[acyl-carrier protein] reductase [Solirubrobacterales bacterium]|jgi:3-oxoacyl-[acyl-carrier protein] reductase|nr:3-oxoacyl-[acyl-carrier protein] reductase [Solirubrobacterales bacterium]